MRLKMPRGALDVVNGQCAQAETMTTGNIKATRKRKHNTIRRPSAVCIGEVRKLVTAATAIRLTMSPVRSFFLRAVMEYS